MIDKSLRAESSRGGKIRGCVPVTHLPDLTFYAANASPGCLMYSLEIASETVKQVSRINRQSFSTEGVHFR